MAIVRAVKSGNWSDVTVWNTGALPTSADDVYSNTFTVTIDTSATVLSIRNGSATGVASGGGFVISADGITLALTGGGILSTVNASGVITINNPAGTTVNLIFSNIGMTGVVSWYTASFTGSGTLNITGNVSSTLYSAGGFYLNGAGTVNITGNLTGSSYGTSTTGALFSAASSVTVNATGNHTADRGATISNGSSSLCTLIGTLTSSNLLSPIGGGRWILTGPFLTSSTGINPIPVNWFWMNSNVAPTYYQIRTANLATIRPLYTADSVGGNPAVTNVRSGTVYGPAGELTGTCAVPPAGSVALGVPVDNTTGTATLTAANIRSALGMASANLDTQLAPLTNLDAAVSTRLSAASYQAPLDASETRTAIGLAAANLDTQLDSLPTAAENAQAVRTELSPELDLIDVATSTRLASADYVTPPTSVQNAQAVRTELSPELSNLDSTVSSRLASADYTTPPTPEQNAQAVEIQLSLPLGNLDAAVSSRSTFNPTTDTVAHVTLVDTTTDLTNPPVVPTPEQIATAVRIELEPELSRIDADVTSRLAAADYEQPPTPEQNAEAVRNELTPELERLSNCATVATTGEQIQDAWARSPNV